jgi:DNA repair protein RecN (Recombination protein N)
MPRTQLVELYAHGLGVIEDARVEFGPGFNVITGETGAGKTLLLGALDLCLGGEGAAARRAGEEVRAAAVFARADGTEVALTREAPPGGRLRSAVDGAPASAEALRRLAEELVVVHGQHDSLRLRQRGAVRALIDAAGGVDTTALDEVRAHRREVEAQRERLGGDPAARERELDLLSFQVAELEAAQLRGPDELDETLAELQRLSELRDAQAVLASVVEVLDGEGEDAVLARLAAALSRLPKGSAVDGPGEVLRGALVAARDAVGELAGLSDPEAIDLTRLEALDERVGRLRALARKYGGSLPSALETLETLRTRAGELAAAEEQLERLDVQALELAEREGEAARQVRAAREAAAASLSERVAAQLPRVALAHAHLRFVVAGEDGSDTTIAFAPNPGRPEGALDELASGGELSRVLLAISLETVGEGVVAVFDEVDAGVGGEVAQQIGECLAELGVRQQVLAVTHLASVAARADHHVLIEKTVEGGRAATRVRLLSGEERVAEIARMLAGSRVTEESRALAVALLRAS